MSKIDDALNLFKQGFSCSQAIFAVYAVDYGMDYDTALKVSQAFGGGMGGMRGECSAVTGAYMVISLIYGRTKAEDGQSRLKTYGLVKEFSRRFREIHQSTVCKELLEGKSGNHYDLCSIYVKTACELLEELLDAKE